mmetsp:Transcript_12857/g.30243  ORF Transcript_12857/g.30243 Transcript_12857/m.30243 type:complete len:93 (+) Transcript_12857:166-444(+)
MSDDRGDPSTGLDCAGALFVETGHPILGRVLRASACIVPGTLLVRERPVMAMTPLRELDAPERKPLGRSAMRRALRDWQQVHARLPLSKLRL